MRIRIVESKMPWQDEMTLKAVSWSHVSLSSRLIWSLVKCKWWLLIVSVEVVGEFLGILLKGGWDWGVWGGSIEQNADRPPERKDNLMGLIIFFIRFDQFWLNNSFIWIKTDITDIGGAKGGKLRCNSLKIERRVEFLA